MQLSSPPALATCFAQLCLFDLIKGTSINIVLKEAMKAEKGS
jgi:hypothetical protein